MKLAPSPSPEEAKPCVRHVKRLGYCKLSRQKGNLVRRDGADLEYSWNTNKAQTQTPGRSGFGSTFDLRVLEVTP